MKHVFPTSARTSQRTMATLLQSQLLTHTRVFTAYREVIFVIHLYLNSWSRILENKISPQVNKNSPHFTEPEGSLLCLLQPVTCPIMSQMNLFHAILPHCLQIRSTTYSNPCVSFNFPQPKSYTGLFISPSGISELDCATTKTDTAERSISIGRESLQVFFWY